MKLLLRQRKSIEKLLKKLRLHNNFLRTKSQEDRLEYNKWQNICKKLLKTNNSYTLVTQTSKKQLLIENFSIKFAKDDKILLNENDKSVSNGDELCQIFLATYLISIYKDISRVTGMTDSVLAAIIQVLRIQEQKTLNQIFLLHTRTKQKSKNTLEA